MRQHLFTIAPHAQFLPTLAERVLDGTLLPDWPRQGPFWLTDVTIVLPTRRARLALADAFARRGVGLLPDIRTFGGEAGDEEPFLPPIDAPTLPPAVSRLERRLVLAQLIAAWAKTPDGLIGFASPPNAAETLALADSLGQLLDDLATENAEIARLDQLTAERDLAADWQETLRFLDIVLKAWPQILAERGKADASVLRNERLARQAAAAPLIFGDRPVIAAGSTGSIPATASLLQALSRLPRGAVVLPGLDTTLAPADHAALLDEQQAPHGHPQYGLAKLLYRLRATPSQVTELATEGEAPRTAVVRRALALPDATARWVIDRAGAAPALAGATEGLAILVARTEEEEARAIAVAARAALSDGRTVGVVSPDRNLARRIAAELGRFDIRVDDAAGTPLFQSAAGRLVRLILAVASGEFAPVDLMALLRNPATRLGLPRAQVSRMADLIELGLLRGQRPRPGIDGLHQALADNVERRTERVPRRLTPEMGLEITDLLDRLGAALAPLCALLATGNLTAAKFAQSLAEAYAEIVAAPAREPESAIPGAGEFAAWAGEITARPGEGPSFAATGLDSVLFALMAGAEVRNTVPRRDDIAIWGQLEARLQSPDLMILAGLNEDVWPEAADPGPWLSRGMRLAIGLEPPERKQGLAAHDFEMALGNATTLIALSQRLGTSPALPSRLVQRLEAFVGEDIAKSLRQRGAQWLAQARAIDAVVEARPARRPVPRPPAKLRPRRLSITEIETLFRSPYDIYAKHVLRLRKLDPLGEEPGGRERGNLIHEVFARFVIDGHDFAAPDALAKLEAMAEKVFSGLDAIGERRDIWLRRFSVAAQGFLDFENERTPRLASRHAEIEGEWAFPLLGGFQLIGRADRIDQLTDGTLEIIDFKTGSIPEPRAMTNFEAPQLPLEAAMAKAGGFKVIAPANASALTFIKIGLGPEAFLPFAFKPREDLDLMGAADEVSRRLQGHVSELLLKDVLPMAASIRPDVKRRYRGDYEHLARTDEWALAEGDDSE